MAPFRIESRPNGMPPNPLGFLARPSKKQQFQSPARRAATARSTFNRILRHVQPSQEDIDNFSPLDLNKKITAIYSYFCFELPASLTQDCKK
jgi:hypothetical protein